MAREMAPSSSKPPAAVHAAAVEVRDKAIETASHLLEASPADLEVAAGRVFVSGAPGQGFSLAEVAARLAGLPGYALPAGLAPGLTRVGGPGCELVLAGGGADQLHLWDQPPKVLFVGKGERPRINGRARDESALAAGDRP